MDRIKKWFDKYVEEVFGGREKMSDKQLAEEQETFYAGFSVCYHFFRCIMPELSDNEAVFKLYMIETELKEFTDGVLSRINEVKKNG